MVNKSFFRFLVIVSFLIFAEQILFSKDKAVKKKSSEEPLVIREESGDNDDVSERWQYLEWEESNPDYVMFYNVIIQKFDADKNTYGKSMEIRTKANETRIAIRPRLEPGEYRFKIITYDLLGMSNVESDWMRFFIAPARKPYVEKIEELEKEKVTFFLEEYRSGIFNIVGNNLFLPKDASESNMNWTVYSFENKNGTYSIKPEILEHSDDNTSLKIHLNMKGIMPGTYQFVAVDASGLKDYTKINLKYRKSTDFNLSVGLSVPFILFDETIPEKMGNSFSYKTLYAKTSVICIKMPVCYFGFGFDGHYSYWKNETDIYELKGSIIDGYFDLIMQIPFFMNVKKEKNQKKNVSTLEFYGGSGVLLFNNFAFEFANGSQTENFNAFYISTHLGIDMKFYIGSYFFVESGADFVYAFISDMKYGTLIPSLGIGCRL